MGHESGDSQNPLGDYDAARSKNSTFTASNGKTIPPLCARSRTPALRSAVMSLCTALTSLPTRRAASRMETGPAPHSALRTSHRLAVSTFQRSSGEAKLMRADFSGLPVFHTRAKSFIASPGSRTSRVTVFMVPPRNIALKVSDELVWRLEGIGAFLPIDVPVIALADLVVIAHDADAVHDVRQPILVPVRRAGHWFRNLPE